MNVVNSLYNRLRVLPITDLAPVFTTGVRGRTMSASSCSWLLPKVRELGVKTIIDLRTADHTDKFERKVIDAGLAYYHIAIDGMHTDASEIIASLPDFFSRLDEGNYYMACAMGLHRTDIAIALYYVFHPVVPFDCVPELRGHRKNGVLRCDDIARRLNSIMGALTPNDIIRMGLPDDYRDEFNRRKNIFLLLIQYSNDCEI